MTQHTSDPAPQACLVHVAQHTPLLDKLAPRERLALSQTSRMLYDIVRQRGGVRAAVAALTQERFDQGRTVAQARFSNRVATWEPDAFMKASTCSISPSNLFVAVACQGTLAVLDVRTPQAPPDCYPCDPRVEAQWSPMQDLLLSQAGASLYTVSPSHSATPEGVVSDVQVLSNTESGHWLPHPSRAAWVDSGDQIITCEHPGHLVSVRPGSLKKRSIWVMPVHDGRLERILIAPSGSRVLAQTSGPSYIINTHTDGVSRCKAPTRYSLPTWVDNERALALNTRQAVLLLDATSGALRHRIAINDWPLASVSPTAGTVAVARPDFFDGHMVLSRAEDAGQTHRFVRRLNNRTGVADNFTLVDLTWSNTGRHLAARSNKRFVHLLDVDQDWQTDTVLDDHACETWSPSGAWLAAYARPMHPSRSASIQMHTADGKFLWARNTRDEVRNIAWSDDEASLALFYNTGACEVMHFTRRFSPSLARA